MVLKWDISISKFVSGNHNSIDTVNITINSEYL